MMDQNYWKREIVKTRSTPNTSITDKYSGFYLSVEK